MRTHTLKQPYLDSDTTSRWYDFGGDTIVRTDSYVAIDEGAGEKKKKEEAACFRP